VVKKAMEKYDIDMKKPTEYHQYAQVLAEMNEENVSDQALFEQFERQIRDDSEFVTKQNGVLAEIAGAFN
jgi:hypothetical protein